MNKRNFMFKEVLSDDPAGQVVEDELRSLTCIEVEDPSGCGTPVIGLIVQASIALCPTTVCTSKCDQPKLPEQL